MKKTLVVAFLTAAGMLFVTGCVSTIESKADGGDINSMKKMARLYNGETVFVYDPDDELPILGAFTEAVVGKPAKDVTKSFAWMKRAAEKGDIAAILTIGRYYAEGFGTEKSFKDSAIWFDKALKATADTKNNQQQVSYDDICKEIFSCFDENLTSSNVIDYYDVLLQLQAAGKLNSKYICSLISENKNLSFDEKVKYIDTFSKDFKYSDNFASAVNVEIFNNFSKYNNVDAEKILDAISGIPLNIVFCSDYNILEQIRKENKWPDRYKKSSMIPKMKDEVPFPASDRGTYFGTRAGDKYFMIDIPDKELSNLYEYTRPLTEDERTSNMLYGTLLGLTKGKSITPIVVFSNDFDENNFLYPEMYLFGVRKTITGIKVEDIIAKLQSEYKNLVVKNLSEDKVTKIIIGTSYRVTYKPAGYRLENDDIFLTVKSVKDKGLIEPKLEKIKPGDPDYLFALMNAKIHGGFNYSELKGYSQKDKDRIHKEEDKEFEEFFNRELSVDTIEKQLQEYGFIHSLDYRPSDTRQQAWHHIMEARKNYRLQSPNAQETDGMIDMAITSVFANLMELQKQLEGKKEENVVIVECFDKKRYNKAVTQYSKIHKALSKKAEMKSEKEYEEKKKEQLNF